MSGRKLAAVVGVLAVGAVAVLVAGPAGARSKASCGTVTLNEQAWAGSTANTYVAKAVLEGMGCKVKITQIAEIPVYQALADGKSDAVLEDWQHVDQYKQYISKQHTVVMGGPNGVVGHIGWYIPTYLMKAHPEFATWKGLKGKESLFKSPESGSQGMFLGGDPSYVQKDAQLIQALGLNFKFVSVGAEPAPLGVAFRVVVVPVHVALRRIVRVQIGDRLLRFLVCAHLDEREPARAPGGHVAHHLDGLDGSRACEELLELRFPDFVGEVSNIQLKTHH